MKEYIYYWNHHMMPTTERQEIEKVLNNKDYFSFIELYKKYSIKAIEYGQYYKEFESWIPMTYLPSSISVWQDNQFIEYISILDRNNFNKITYHESECG